MGFSADLHPLLHPDEMRRRVKADPQSMEGQDPGQHSADGAFAVCAADED